MQNNASKIFLVAVIIVVITMVRPVSPLSIHRAESLPAAAPLVVLKPPQDSLSSLGANIISQGNESHVVGGDAPQTNTSPQTKSNTTAVLGAEASTPSSQGTEVRKDNPEVVGFVRIKNEAPPSLTLAAATVTDLQTGTSFFERAPAKRWPLASLTKMMTAALVIKNMDLHRELVFSNEDLLLENSVSYVKAGEKYSVDDLLSIMLLASSNEAAELLARGYGRAQLIKDMNTEVAAWGLKDTHFDDPTGLSASNQSTVSDMKIIMGHISSDFPKIFTTTAEVKRAIIEGNSGEKRTVTSIHPFAGKPLFIGGKTGYTAEANGNLASVFNVHGRPVLVMVLGANDRFVESEKLWNWFQRNYQ